MSKTLQLDTAPGAPTTAPDGTAFVDACHILAMEGHARSLAGQVSMRDTTNADHLWTFALGKGLEEVTPADLLRVDQGLQVLQGSGRPNPALRFHGWIYRHRPDVRAIVHTHTPALSAWSMRGLPLPVAHMDTCMFHADCGLLADWPGVPTGDEEGALIATALGGARTALLANHGCVCTGRSLAEAIYLAVFAERSACMALAALATGPLQPITDERAREAHDFLLQPAIVEGTFAYWARQARQARRMRG